MHSYNGNYYGNSSEEKQFTVNRITTTTGVTLAQNTILVGGDAVVTITMDPSINTTVTLKVGQNSYNVAIVKGVGTFTATGLANATYDVTATFAGNYKYIESEGTTKLYVNKVTVYDIGIDVKGVMAGENQTIRVILPHDVNANNNNLIILYNLQVHKLAPK